jgi:hypothetical protein
MDGKPGVLAIWHDVAEGHEAAVTDWYNREHHFERLAVPGFIEAHRYRLSSAQGRQFLSLYRTESPSVLFSAAYLARVDHPSPGTRAVMPHYRNMSRTVCRLAMVSGRAEGGCVATLATAAPAEPGKFQEAFAELMQQGGVLRCRLLVADAAVPATAPGTSAEARLRGNADQRIGWAVVVDTNEPHQAVHALTRIEERLRAQLAGQTILQRAAYRLVYAARAAGA